MQFASDEIVMQSVDVDMLDTNLISEKLLNVPHFLENDESFKS